MRPCQRQDAKEHMCRGNTSTRHKHARGVLQSGLKAVHDTQGQHNAVTAPPFVYGSIFTKRPPKAATGNRGVALLRSLHRAQTAQPTRRCHGLVHPALPLRVQAPALQRFPDALYDFLAFHACPSLPLTHYHLVQQAAQRPQVCRVRQRLVEQHLG